MMQVGFFSQFLLRKLKLFTITADSFTHNSTVV
jgi:hypothetical protein